MMQFRQCRKQEMMSSIRLQHYDVTSWKQRHLIEKNGAKGNQLATTTEILEKFPSIKEGVIAFSKKVHVFF